MCLSLLLLLLVLICCHCGDALQVDSAKDMVDNCAGMMLALLALATRAGSKGSAGPSTRA
jgi:hypothetical protein